MFLESVSVCNFVGKACTMKISPCENAMKNSLIFKCILSVF